MANLLPYLNLFFQSLTLPVDFLIAIQLETNKICKLIYWLIVHFICLTLVCFCVIYCETAPCKQLACQHLCISTGRTTAQCTCYDGYYLATDRTQCIGKPPCLTASLKWVEWLSDVKQIGRELRDSLCKNRQSRDLYVTMRTVHAPLSLSSRCPYSVLTAVSRWTWVDRPLVPELAEENLCGISGTGSPSCHPTNNADCRSTEENMYHCHYLIFYICVFCQ